MNDKNKKVGKDDEYHFPNDEYLDESVEATAATSSGAPVLDDSGPHVTPPPPGFFQRFPLLKNMKFLFFVLIVIVIIIGVSMMRSRSKQPSIAQQQPVVTQPKASDRMVQTAQQADLLQQQEQSSQKALSNVSQSMNKVSEQLNSVVAINSQLSQQVGALTQQVSHLMQQVNQNTKKLVVTPKKKLKKSIAMQPKPVKYHINAIIYGRAWLKGTDNHFISVAAGDEINRFYGKVKSIDSTQGKVLTSSGKVIGYGQNDY